MTDAVMKRATVEPSVTGAIAFAQHGDNAAFEWLVAVFSRVMGFPCRTYSSLAVLS